eukprot:454463-Lingulodinium_polyedra.AAC.1
MITGRAPGRAVGTGSTRAAQLASRVRPLSPDVRPVPWPWRARPRASPAGTGLRTPVKRGVAH